MGDMEPFASLRNYPKMCGRKPQGSEHGPTINRNSASRRRLSRSYRIDVGGGSLSPGDSDRHPERPLCI